MIQVEDYLKRILSYYQNSFDLTVPYLRDGKNHAALAAMHAHEDQYVRMVGTTLWNADSHEYTLFDTYDSTPTVEQIEENIRIAVEQMEPEFVRKGEKLPPKDHQYTWLSLVFLSQNTPADEVLQAVQKAKMTKYYQFYLRGYSELRVILVDLERGRMTTNRAGRGLKKLYEIALKNAQREGANKV